MIAGDMTWTFGLSGSWHISGFCGFAKLDSSLSWTSGTNDLHQLLSHLIPLQEPLGFLAASGHAFCKESYIKSIAYL